MLPFKGKALTARPVAAASALCGQLACWSTEEGSCRVVALGAEGMLMVRLDSSSLLCQIVVMARLGPKSPKNTDMKFVAESQSVQARATISSQAQKPCCSLQSGASVQPWVVAGTSALAPDNTSREWQRSAGRSSAPIAAVQVPLVRLQSQSSQRTSGISRIRVLQTQTRLQSALHLCSHLSSPTRSCGGKEGRLRSCSSMQCILRSR